MKNSIRKLEKDLRSFAKRCKNIKFTSGLVLMYLLTGMISMTAVTDSDINAQRRSISNSITDMKQSFKQAKVENNKLLKNANLELIQLMEQGDQVVKSPWNSWYIGINYFYNNWNSTYKGRRDKIKDREGIFERLQGMSKYTQGTEAKYGNTDLDLINTAEPKSSITVNVSIEPRVVNKNLIEAPDKTVNIPKLPATVDFSPASPNIPTIEPTNISIRDITLSALYNGDSLPGSQYQFPNTTSNIVIEDGYNYTSRTFTNVTGSTPLTTPYTRTKTFSASEILKTSDGEDYRVTLAGYGYLQGSRHPNRNVTYGAIFEFYSGGDFEIKGLTMEVDDVSGYTGNRAISTDGSADIKVTNNSNIKLTADGSVGFATDTNATTNVLSRIHTNGTDGLIYSTGIGNAAFIFVDENQNTATITYEHINQGKIIMDGEGSQAFAFSKTTGNKDYIIKSINENEIVLTGKSSYGFGLGTERVYNTVDSYILNSGSIALLGDSSIGIVTQSLLNKADNDTTGIISISGDNSIGMYSESGTPMTNSGTINIQDYSKNFTSTNAGTLWLNNTTYSKKDAIKSVGMRTGNAISTITNSTTGNINITTGTSNIGAYSSAGNVVNNGTITATTDSIKSLGMYVTGSNATGTNGTGAVILINSDGGSGLVVQNSGIITNSGSVTVNGGHTQNDTEGTVGVVVGENSTINSQAGTINVSVTGNKSIGVYSNGTLNMGTGNIDTKNGAVNLFADNTGTLNIVAGTTLSTTTGQKSLLFYNGTSGTGVININGTLNATVEGGTDESNRGTAFFYTPSVRTAKGIATGYNDGINYGSFNTVDIQNYFNNSFGGTLNNVNITMNDNSRLFVTSNVKMNLSDTNITTIPGGPNITGSNYKTFMLYSGELTINNAVNLDDNTDLYRQLEISNSSIINQNVMTADNIDTVAMAQENKTSIKGTVTLLNDTTGRITLNGNSSLAAYVKNGNVINKGQILLTGVDSTGLYGTDNSKVYNESSGTITLNENNGTGMFFKNSSLTNLTSEVAQNDGTIEGTSNSSVGMMYDAGKLDNIVTPTVSLIKNDGKITFTGDKNIGIYALRDTDNLGYTVENNGDIVIVGDSAMIDNPNVGIYTTGENNRILTGSNSNIITDAKTVGIFGYGVENNGNITVGDGGIGIYSQGGNVILNNGTLKIGNDESVGLYISGSNQNVNVNNGAKFDLSDNSFGIVDSNETGGNNINSNVATVELLNKSIYIYSTDTTGNIRNFSDIMSKSTSTGENFAIYSSGNVENHGTINFNNGDGNIGIYVNGANGNAVNKSNGIIYVGHSDTIQNKYAVGMAAKNGAKVENEGNIYVSHDNGIGMYASGAGSKAINKAGAIIYLSGNNAIGMYLDDYAVGENYGNITTTVNSTGTGIIGIYTLNNAVIKNYGTIKIEGTDAIGVYVGKDGSLEENGGSIVATGLDADSVYKTTITDTSKSVGNVSINLPYTGALTADIVRNGVYVIPTVIDTDTASPNANYIYAGTTVLDVSSLKIFENMGAGYDRLGLYVDTSGINYTNPIEGLHYLTNLRRINLLFGTEATKYTNDKNILIGQNIIAPYNTAITNVSKANPAARWEILSSSLTWIATATQNTDDTLANVYLVKIPYTAFAKDTNTYNFMAGLEEKYDTAQGTEKEIFDKLNDLGKGEGHILAQAVDQMKGHQYANIQHRIHATGNILDNEITALREDWTNNTKQTNKMNVFGVKDEYSTNTAGIYDYTSNAYGVAYIKTNETLKLGNNSGWYAGAVHNKFKFKDVGKSKENVSMLKAGLFNTKAFDDNGSLRWTIAGEGFVSRSEMDRNFLIVDKFYNAKAQYNTYGVALDNKIEKEVRLSERTSLTPYGSLKLEYGRFGNITEKSDAMKLEIKANDYISVKPEVGVEFAYKQPIAKSTRWITSLGVGYSTELGEVDSAKNKAKLKGTNAEWYNLRDEKENRKGHLKADLKLGIENQKFGITLNTGYDTKGENFKAGIGFRAIF